MRCTQKFDQTPVLYNKHLIIDGTSFFYKTLFDKETGFVYVVIKWERNFL